MIEHTISDQIRISAEAFNDSTALIFPEENLRISYKELKTRAEVAAKALLGCGMRKGSHIGIWSVNCSRWVDLVLGAAMIGVVTIPLNINYKTNELAEICEKMDVECLFVMNSMKGSPCTSVSEGLLNGEKPDHRLCPRLEQIISMASSDCGKHPNYNSFLDTAEKVHDEDLIAAQGLVVPGDTYIIQLTSGTTALPKGVMLSHYGALNTARDYAVDMMHFGRDDISCVPLPLFHCYGNILTLLGGLITGSCVLYPPLFSPTAVLNSLVEEKCTSFAGVPTMYAMLMNTEGFSREDLHLRTSSIGGSYVAAELVDQITEEFNVPGLVVGYGLSEAASLVTLSPVDELRDKRLYSVGSPLPGLEVTLFDPKTGVYSSSLQEGEVVIRGFCVMQGYYNDPEATAKAIDAEGWLHTGDLGSFNPNGTMRIVGRIKDIIIRGGENISPSEIEAKIIELAQVSDCQCVGVPDKVLGEEIAAFIITKDRSPIEESLVKAHVRTQLARHKIPKYVFTTDSFPLNGAGKVMKSELRKMAESMIQTGKK